jgi:cytochrome c-type biogenesis protein CcmH
MINTHSPLVLFIFWSIIVVVLIGAAWWILIASVRGQSEESDRADLDVYADQVGELDRDLAQGRISPQAADAGRLEIGRRLVKARDRVLDKGKRLDRRVVSAIAASVALLTGGMYALSGSPGLGDLPFVQRERELLARDPATLTQDEILILLQERARQNPDDAVPHALMAQVLASAGRDQDALRAYQAVLRRTPDDSEAIAEAAGILVRLSDGQMNPDAKSALDAALKINPKSPAARYYLALADWQAGRKDEAVAAWSSAYNAQEDGSPGASLLAARVVEVMSKLDRGPQMDGDPTARPADPTAMISSMIGARTARLSANPDDVALRLSLVRVLMMNGQQDSARKALLDGVERAQTQPFYIALYGVAARALRASQTRGTAMVPITGASTTPPVTEK